MALFEAQENLNINEQPETKVQELYGSQLNNIYQQRREEYAQAQEEQNAWVRKNLSPEKIQEFQNAGKMTALETWNKFDKYKLLPYVGTVAQGHEAFTLKGISDKIKRGEVISEQEKKQMEEFVLDMAEVQTRGMTLGGKLVDFGVNTLPFVAEFGLGLLTSGGTASLGATSAKIAQKQAVKAVEQSVAKTIAKGVGKVAYDATINPRTIAFSATRLPQQIYARMGEIQLNDSVSVTPQGQLILNEAQSNPATALLKAFALTNIEVGSEMAGMTLFDPVKRKLSGLIAPKILDRLPKKFASKLVETVEKTTNLPFFRAVESLGFNGVLEEMGEERVADVLKFAFNLDEKEGYSFEQLLDAVFPYYNDPEQLAIELIGFAGMGVGANLVNKGLQKVSETYSKDDFLIDAGVFRAGGTLDKLDKKVKSILEGKGRTEEEINDVLQHASRDTKVQFLKDENIDTIEVATEEEKRLNAFSQSMQEELFNKLIEQGYNENQANNIALQYGAQARKLLEEGNAEEDIRKVLAVEFTNEKIEKAQAEMDGGNIETAKTIISKIMPKDETGNKAMTFDSVSKMFKTNANKFVQNAHYEIRELEKNKTEEIKKVEEVTQKASGLYQVLISKPLLEKGSKKRGSHRKRNKKQFAEYEIKYGNYQENLKEFLNIIGVEFADNINIYNEYVKFIQRQDNAIEAIKNNIDEQIRIKKAEIDEAYKVYRFAKKKFANRTVIDEQANKKGKKKKVDYKKELVDKLVEEYSAENLKYVRFQPGGTFDSGNPNIFYQSARNSYNEEKKNLVADIYKDQVKFYNGEWIHRSLLEKKGIDFEKVEIGDYLDFFEKSAREPRAEYNPEFDNIAKEYFGTTTNLNEAGYILNDGSLLDLSGKNMGGMAGRRSLDHREVNSAFIETENPDYEDVGFNEFIDNGAIRFMPESNSFLIARMPSEKQFDELKKIIDKKNGEVFIELVDEMEYWGSESHSFKKEYERFSNVDKILDDVRTFFNGGKISKFKTYFQSAYHGTPHRFAEFSLDAIGTGEGAQAHGWGLYFAENKNVSEEYRKRLIQAYGGVYHDLYLYQTPDNKQAIIEYKNNPVRADIDEDGYLDLFYQIKTNGKEKAKKYLEENNYPDYTIDKIDVIDPDDINIVYTDDIIGQLYEVDIPDNDVLLDEDKTIKEQSEKVKEALRKLCREEGFNYLKVVSGFSNEMKPQTGKQIYNNLRNFIQWKAEENGNKISDDNSAKEASLLLNKYGIKGITYDGHRDGRCYVIFDDKAVKILNTFYQELENQEQENMPLIAGFNVLELQQKLEQLYEELGNMPQGTPDEEIQKLNAKIHVISQAMDFLYRDNVLQKDFDEVAVNTFYVMNDEELPEDYMRAEKQSARSMRELKEVHEEKKRKQEEHYTGYYTKEGNKSFIGVMESADASTIPHELAHLYLEAINVLAQTNAKTRERLDEINEWLGSDGTGYTVDMHEKFATTYEAYLANGKAPSNTLREVFENFKEWLKASFRQAIIERVEITPEAQAIFDKMLGNGDYSKKEKAINELLTKVKEKKKKTEPKKEVVEQDESKITEYQRRYKEVAYDILETATGKQKRYLKTILENQSKTKAQALKSESIRSLIEEVQDEITITGGMREEWKEFFTDTGVNYDSDVVGGDYELAMKAYYVIVNKSYLKADSFSQYEDDWAINIRESIDEADYQYKKLVIAYKNYSKDVALGAFYEWLDGINPEIKNDYKERFLNDIRQIDRIENQKDVERAKDRIIKRALEIENKYGINSNEGYVEFVKSAIGNLTFLSAQDKARLAVNILDISSMDMLMGRINGIMDIAQTMQEVAYRRKLEFDIRKELMTTKNVKKGARTVGKYDYRTNKIFEKLREINKLSPEKAHELLLNEQRMAQAEDESFSEEEKLYNKYLKFKADGRTFADATLMKEIYDEITKIKLVGKTAKNEQELLDKISENKEVERMVKILENKKKGGFAIKQYLSKMGNLESFFTGIFNAEVKEEYATELLYAETQAQTWQYEQKQKFEKEVARIYGLPQWNWDSQIIKYLAEKHTFDEYRREYDKDYNLVKTKTITKELTKMDVILAYMWSCNEVLKQRLVNMFGEAQLDEMVEMLSNKDIEFAHLMLKTAQSSYNIVNQAFIRKYGLDLPRVNAYFPSKVERGTEIDMFNDYSSKSLNNSFTKERTQSEIAVMEFSNPVQILYNHIDGVAKFGFMTESLDKINLIFKNKTFLKPLIENTYGKEVYDTFMQALLNVTYKAESQVYNGFAKVINTLSSNWIQANIAIKPLVALKQLLSANNYALDMPATEWTIGFIKGILDFKNTIDFMWSIPYVRARFGGSYSNEFLKQTIENSAFATTKKLKDFLSMNVKLGDVGALIFGGKPYIDYQISKGVSKEEAIKQFVLSTNRSQQSAAISSMSNFQIWAGRQPLAKVMTAYRNSQQQYARKCGDAIVEYANGDITLRKCAQTIFHYMFLQPFIFTLAGSGSLMILLTQGDDDDLIADVVTSMTNFCMDALPFLHEVYSFAIKKLVLKQKYVPVNTPLWGDIIKEIQRISKEDADFEDYIKGWGYLLGNIASGVPVPTVANQVGGIVDICSDKYLKGLFRLIGYSERRATRMSGETEEKAKKKNKKKSK